MNTVVLQLLKPTPPPSDKQMALPFTSRRSPVLCRHGCVACSQPLAAEIGLQVLRRGGNAADAAVAVAATLNVTEPCSTGIGGDCFCLFYDASSKEVQGINGRYRVPLIVCHRLAWTEGSTRGLWCSYACTLYEYLACNL